MYNQFQPLLFLNMLHKVQQCTILYSSYRPNSRLPNEWWARCYWHVFMGLTHACIHPSYRGKSKLTSQRSLSKVLFSVVFVQAITSASVRSASVVEIIQLYRQSFIKMQYLCFGKINLTLCFFYTFSCNWRSWKLEERGEQRSSACHTFLESCRGNGKLVITSVVFLILACTQCYSQSPLTPFWFI